MREFRLFAGVVALALLPGIGAAYADVVETPTDFFAFGTFLNWRYPNGASFTMTVKDNNGNPVTLSTAPITSVRSIALPQEISVTGFSIVFSLTDAEGNPLIDYAGALVESVTPQQSVLMFTSALETRRLPTLCTTSRSRQFRRNLEKTLGFRLALCRDEKTQISTIKTPDTTHNSISRSAVRLWAVAFLR